MRERLRRGHREPLSSDVAGYRAGYVCASTKMTRIHPNSLLCLSLSAWIEIASEVPLLFLTYVFGNNSFSLCPNWGVFAAISDHRCPLRFVRASSSVIRTHHFGLALSEGEQERIPPKEISPPPAPIPYPYTVCNASSTRNIQLTPACICTGFVVVVLLSTDFRSSHTTTSAKGGGGPQRFVC